MRWSAVFVASVTLCIVPVGARAQQDTTARRQQRTLDSLVAAMRAMQAKIDSFGQVGGAAQQPAVATAHPRTSGAYMNISFVGLTDFGWATTPDVQSLQLGDHDPHVRGFSIPNSELALDGTVDPYFKAFSNIFS